MSELEKSTVILHAKPLYSHGNKNIQHNYNHFTYQVQYMHSQQLSM